MNGRLPVRPRGRMKLKTSVVADQVVARLLEADGSEIAPVGRRLRVRRLSPRRWAVALPRDLGEAEVLDVFIRWSNPRDGRGDADFWGGIRHGCRDA